VVAVHVHHGLTDHADEWLAHCEREAAALGVRFIGRHVSVRRGGRGIEAAARDARYQALADAATECRARVVCCAHHRYDRLETFLIQWLARAGSRPGRIPGARPFAVGDFAAAAFIDIARDDVRRYVDQRKLAFIEDDSTTIARCCAMRSASMCLA
jgi:tRNA(Ile)-lysidine synthase